VVAVAGGATLGPASPAFAAPGDASARGVVIDLDASVGNAPPVIAANVTIGSAIAPSPSGTDTDNGLAVTLPPGTLGVTASGTVVQVSATREATASSANASVANLALGILNITGALTATVATATVNCPRVGAQTADTTLTGATLFGTPVTVVPNTPVNQSFVLPAGTVPGLAQATLFVQLTTVETTTATGATAIALVANLRLTGIVIDNPVSIPVGSVILAEAICERPAAAPSTTPPATPRPILPVTGSSDSSTGLLLAVGTAMILIGAVTRMAFRRRSERASSVS
jgi:hypothetical protein